MILVQLVPKVLTEFSNFAIGHHHVLTVIVYHNGEIPPPWLTDNQKMEKVKIQIYIRHILLDATRDGPK
jgi:hypothetical protein